MNIEQNDMLSASVIVQKSAPALCQPSSTQRVTLPVVNLCDVSFASVTAHKFVIYVMDELAGGRGGWVVTPNLDILRRIVKDMAFRRLIANASVLVADGMPLVWASHIQGTPLPQRVAGSSLISTLSEAAAECGRSIFLLGGDRGTAQKAAGVLQQRHRNLRIGGTCCPPMGFENDAQEMDRLVAALRDASPDIVFVALGSPKQERLIEMLRQQLPRAWWLGVGISFSFLCGDVKRAPRWMQQAGLEWVHRLVQEPRRLARRYLAYGLPFAARLLIGAAWRRVTVKAQVDVVVSDGRS